MNDPLLGNKIAGALLASLLLFFGLPQFANMLFGEGGHGGGHEGEDHAHPFPQYPVAFASEGGAAAEEEAPPDLGTLLAAASPAAGERRSGLCGSCHSFERGGPDGIGPNLWDIVGAPVANAAGFNYTGALRAFGGEWTYERLDAFLENSQALVPGTGMAQNIRKPEQRAEILAYLSTLSDDPVAFPEPAPPAETASDAGEEHASSDAEAGPEGHAAD